MMEVTKKAGHRRIISFLQVKVHRLTHLRHQISPKMRMDQILKNLKVQINPNLNLAKWVLMIRFQSFHCRIKAFLKVTLRSLTQLHHQECPKLRMNQFLKNLKLQIYPNLNLARRVLMMSLQSFHRRIKAFLQVTVRSLNHLHHQECQKMRMDQILKNLKVQINPNLNLRKRLLMMRFQRLKLIFSRNLRMKGIMISKN
jgi:hypothetical protein